LVRKEHSFFLFEISEFSYIYIKDYGSVVFINCTENIISDVFNKITNTPLIFSDLPFETFDIYIEKERGISVSFDSIHLHEFDVDIAHVIMLNLAQAVAIENYCNTTLYLLENIRKYFTELEETRKIKLSGKNMRKFFGETVNIKNRMTKNLYIFETSNLAWSKENLAELDTQLNMQLDIKTRYEGLQNNLNVVKDNLDFFQGIYNINLVAC
jgi:uncharacterized Rmd1/YagE family protein